MRRGKGLSRFGKRARREAEALAQFRQDVLSRADWRCERCGATEGALHAHHLLPRSRGGRHEVENGACLCSYCHDGVHTHTVEDWRKWKR